jgi:predicted phage terminase large subunit-like protein
MGDLVRLGSAGGGVGSGGGSLVDFVPALSPEFERPGHLAELGELFERAAAVCRGEGGALRACCTYPIRHWKTEFTSHGVIWLLKQFPFLRIIILAHSFDRAEHLGKRVRELASRTDIGPTKGWSTIYNWQNEHGGGVVVMSADQSKEGHDCHVLIADDPIDEHGAANPQKREEVDRAINYYTARCMMKGRPGPVFLIMSRQHPDDPIGRRLNRTAVKWQHLHQSAIVGLGTPDERAFAPNVWPLEELQRLRVEMRESDPTERVFWSRFQGEPRAEGASYFSDKPKRYLEIPPWAFRDGIGIDMAFTAKRTSDWFAIVRARFVGRQVYLQDVERFKADPREVPQRLKDALAASVNAPIFSYMSGPERGNCITLANDHGISVQAMQPRVNKLWRSQRTIAKWNAGDILVPADAPWARGFIARATLFTGNEGDEDDEIDALVSVCDAMLGLVDTAGPGTVGTRRI